MPIIVAGKQPMNRTTAAAGYLDDTEVHPPGRLEDSLDASGGIVIGVLVGSAAWLTLVTIVVAVVLNVP
jgi:hypothetical protein